MRHSAVNGCERCNLNVADKEWSVKHDRARAMFLAVTVIAVGCLVPTTSVALPKKTKVGVYLGGLDFPVDMAWLEHSSKFFFTEKNTGMVRIVNHHKLLSRPCVDLDVNSAGERGALGITLDPHFRKNHRLYVYYTNASPLENRVARFAVKHNRCTSKKVIVSGLSASSQGYHNGGQLEFVGGKLFVSVGEAHAPSNAQQTTSRLGKILRYNPDGSIPDGNPFSGPTGRNPVWSYGHRNPFGLTHEPGTDRIYETENGPDCDDELNRIQRGRNYGWGDAYSCGSGVGSNPKAPLASWTPTIVPTDPVWYSGRLRSLSGSLYMGDYKNGRLHRINLNQHGSRVTRTRIIYDSPSGILDVSEGPGGWLYFLTPDSVMRITKT